MLIEGLYVEGIDVVLFLRRTESYIVTLQRLGRCLGAGGGKQSVVLDFVNNPSGESIYDTMALHMERLACQPSSKGFEGVTSFPATGFLSDIRLHTEEILTKLEPWQIMYERLIEFRKKENDWPSVTERKLGLWCNMQHMAYERGRFSEKHYKLLESVGLEWNLLGSDWMKELQSLKIFLTAQGRWPKRGDGALTTWCYTQRERRKRGRPSKERIRVLDEIGSAWSQNLNGEWMKDYEALKIFLDKQQHFPKPAKGYLGEWCSRQWEMCKQGRSSPDRQILLDRIGLAWSAEQIWRSYLEQLRRFHIQNGR